MTLRIKVQFLPLLALLIMFAGSVGATGAGTLLQRNVFVKAEQAVPRNIQLARQLSTSLRNYPLYPYLEYAILKSQLASLPGAQVQAFLEKYGDTPLAENLRWRWLNQLASQERWQDYLKFYTPQRNIERQCHYLNALIQTGDRTTAFAQVEPLWLHGKSRPKACDPVFSAWKQANKLTDDLLWQRIELAMNANQVKLARYLGKSLRSSDQAWLNRWIKAHNKPQSVLQDSGFRHTHKYKNKILAHAVKREIRQSVFNALDLWQQIQRRHQFNELETHLMNRKLTFWLLRKEDRTAYNFVANVEPCSHDSKLQETRLRAGLLRQDWSNVLTWLDRLPADEQTSERWQYWRARALQQQTDHAAANKIFTELAKSRSYYGFSAADQVGLPYKFDPAKTPINPQVAKQLEKSPAVARITELIALDRVREARSEWYLFTKGMTDEQLMAAAMLAKSWDWHDQAIFTLAKSDYWDDLELRFPLEHHKPVHTQARATRLDPSWIYGIMRQESAFNASVRSHAGAIGLMQLMPATARYVSKKLLKKKPHSTAQLKIPENNIELGTTYLRYVLDKLEQNPVLATAAYNAGPHRVARWLPPQQLPADIWVELIPYKETRNYVQRVFTYASIYDHRLGRKRVRLSERMPPIEGTKQQTSTTASANL